MKTKMVALQGSEKQIAWAEEIRAKVFSDLEAMPRGAASQEWRDAYVAECMRALAQVRLAKTWIDCRSGDFGARVARMARVEQIAFTVPQ